jgi:hypothetical protein
VNASRRRRSAAWEGVGGFHVVTTCASHELRIKTNVKADNHAVASSVVTFDLQYFPTDELKRHNMVARLPDDFILDQLDPARLCLAAATHRRSPGNLPGMADENLDTLLKQGLTQSHGLLQVWKVAL